MQHNPPSRFLSEIEGNLKTSTQDGWSPSFSGAASSIDSADDEPRYIPELEAGDAISHGLFGRGTVTDVQGEEIMVNFAGRGIKKLNTTFAPIEKIES